MDFSNLGLNMAVVGGIIAITKVITGFDKKGKYARWYPVIPAVLGIAAAIFATSPFVWRTFGNNAIIYTGAATYLYKVGKTTILDK